MMNSDTVLAVCCDLDGTLVDTERLWLDAERAYIESCGKRFDPAVHDACRGVSAEPAVEILRQGYGLEGDTLAIFRAIEQRVHEAMPLALRPKPGASELLSYLQAAGIPCALVSNSTQATVQVTLAQQQWEDAFQVVCPVESVPNPKPAPDLYLHAAAALGVDPAHCLALEDSLSGAQAAVSAGMTCFVIPDLIPAAAFRGITPYTFDSLFAVLERLPQAGR